jgi:hypothetical protein
MARNGMAIDREYDPQGVAHLLRDLSDPDAKCQECEARGWSRPPSAEELAADELLDRVLYAAAGVCLLAAALCLLVARFGGR